MNTVDETCIPKKNDLYVQFGHYNDIKTILNSLSFYPVFITGLSGNGKTFMVEQICSELSRELIRVNVTIETDEDDLIGGFRLVNGSTVWFDGPVIKAMERGSVLLLDEVDLASNKIMCLQPVLEGKGIFIKKINKFVEPSAGFTVVATANTKGQGSDSGKFIGTNILNEAFLERFPATFEQEYPKESVELKILNKVFKSHGLVEEQFASVLLQWAANIRKTHEESGVDDIISTRRLVHIVNAYAMFKDRVKAIDVCINRFDTTTQTAFRQLYLKLDVSKEEIERRAKEAEEAKQKRKAAAGSGLDVASALGISLK